MPDTQAAGRGIGAGQDIGESAVISGDGNSVHIALHRMADASEREVATIQKLAHEIGALANEVNELHMVLAGNKTYGQLGLVQQVGQLAVGSKHRERLQLIIIFVLFAIAIGQVVHTVAIWNLYRIIGWGG